MNTDAINLAAKFSQFKEHWTPKVIAELNDYQIKVVKLEGEFVWHSHEDTDELFLCVEGQLKIELRDCVVTLNPGELYVVPQGVEHKPVAEQECQVVIIEPKGVVNTGENDSELTAPNDAWI